ncbi:MAG: hypothetical protein ACTHMC_23760 [Pseudobacter sp.]|uniref:hypothetical protein n=1 Tax=Pseudobacter sp. TaxID=2045420 RepID=UPI003F8091AE
MDNTLINRLWKEMELRSVSAAQFAASVNIPVDRVYKWKSKGTNPKAEDTKKIEKWLLGGKPDKVPHETLKKGEAEEIFLNGPVKITAQEYVDALKRDKEQLQKVLDLNLAAMQAMLNSLRRHDQAFHETMLRSLARLEKKKSEDLLILEAHTRNAALQVEEGGKGIPQEDTSDM